MIKKEINNNIISALFSYIGAIVVGAIMGLAICKLIYDNIFIKSVKVKIFFSIVMIILVISVFLNRVF